MGLLENDELSKDPEYLPFVIQGGEFGTLSSRLLAGLRFGGTIIQQFTFNYNFMHFVKFFIVPLTNYK